MGLLIGLPLELPMRLPDIRAPPLWIFPGSRPRAQGKRNTAFAKSPAFAIS
jgi:hypothetical protein